MRQLPELVAVMLLLLAAAACKGSSYSLQADWEAAKEAAENSPPPPDCSVCSDSTGVSGIH
jgi:hypothetical protein